MKVFSANDFRAKNVNAAAKAGPSGRDFTLQRVRRFQEADESLKEACARLGIEKPVMAC